MALDADDARHLGTELLALATEPGALGRDQKDVGNDPIAGTNGRDALAHPFDDPCRLMPHDEGKFGRIAEAVEQLEISAVDAARGDPDHGLARTRERIRNVFERKRRTKRPQ